MGHKRILNLENMKKNILILLAFILCIAVGNAQGYIKPIVTQTIATEDEGSTIDSQATTLDFVGAGVVATDSGAGVTTVTIAGGAGTPTLQEVTDQGNSTTTQIRSSHTTEGVGFFVSTLNYSRLNQGGLDISTSSSISTQLLPAQGELRMKTGSSFRTDLKFTPATGDRVVTIKDETGTVALLSDITVSNYDVYTALITQTSTNSPTVTILENTLGFTPTLARTSTGIYTITQTDSFDPLKTVVFFEPKQFSADLSRFNTGLFSNDFVQISTFNSSDTLTDALLSSCSIEIRIYP